jgi:hypothetical protein
MFSFIMKWCSSLLKWHSPNALYMWLGINIHRVIVLPLTNAITIFKLVLIGHLDLEQIKYLHTK